MKRWLLIILVGMVVSWGLVIAAVWAFARPVRGSGRVLKETRPVAGVARVRLESVGELIITQGPSESLVVEGEDNLLPLITTVVEGDQLTIGRVSGRRGNLWPKRPLRYRLTVRDLSDVALDGAGSVHAEGLNTRDLHLGLSGAGAVELSHLNAETLTAELDGAGGMTVSGAVKEQHVTLSGAGGYTAPDLTSARCEVSVEGLGGAEVNCAEALTADISGLGSISYRGHPKSVAEHVEGLGQVSAAE